MGLFDFFRKSGDDGGVKVKSDPVVDANQLAERLASGKLYAGETVTTITALAQDTFYACVRDKAESIGQLPVIAYRTTGGKKKQITQGRDWEIFTQRPNAFQSMQDLFETIVTNLETEGNFYAYIERNTLGQTKQIIPFRYPSTVNVAMDNYGRVYYTYVTNDGRRYGMDYFDASNIWHIKLNSVNGFKGMSPVRQNKGLIGTAIAQSGYLEQVFGTGNLSNLVLETAQVFKDGNAIDRLRQQWSEKYGGKLSIGKPIILENGLTAKPLNINPADAELLGQSKQLKQQICAITRVPSSRLNDSETSKYSNVENNNRAYLTDALMPIITKIEYGLNQLSPSGVVLNIDESYFVRGDRESQVRSVTEEFKNCIISMGSAQRKLGYDPVEGADDLFAINTNNITLGKIEDIQRIQEQVLINRPGAIQNEQ